MAAANHYALVTLEICGPRLWAQYTHYWNMWDICQVWDTASLSSVVSMTNIECRLHAFLGSWSSIITQTNTA